MPDLLFLKKQQDLKVPTTAGGALRVNANFCFLFKRDTKYCNEVRHLYRSRCGVVDKPLAL